MKQIKNQLLVLLIMTMVSMTAQAATVAYTLNNVILDDGRQMTGSFQ